MHPEEVARGMKTIWRTFATAVIATALLVPMAGVGGAETADRVTAATCAPVVRAIAPEEYGGGRHVPERERSGLCYRPQQVPRSRDLGRWPVLLLTRGVGDVRLREGDH
jgi:hypothetical protein